MFHGSIVALVTPFLPDGEVDYDTLKELAEWHVQEGTDAIVTTGTTGESPTLSPEEKTMVLKTVLDVVNKRIPVIAGTGTNDTRLTLYKTQEAKEMGADGCLVIVPYYNRPTPEGCMAHFKEVAKANLPIIFYHHPGRTGVKLAASVIANIAEIPQVVAIKEASGDFDLVMDLIRLTSKTVLSGDDTLALPFMNLGMKGVISIVANIIPRGWKQLISSLEEGNRSIAKALHERYLNLCKSLVIETNPQGVKYALSLMGRCHPDLRLPLIEPQESTKKEIREAMLRLNLMELPIKKMAVSFDI